MATISIYGRFRARAALHGPARGTTGSRTCTYRLPLPRRLRHQVWNEATHAERRGDAEGRTDVLVGTTPEARGELTLRGRTRNVTLPFTLVITGNRAVMNGRTTIDRTDFGIGADTDADDMISRDVEVVVHVEAVRGS